MHLSKQRASLHSQSRIVVLLPALEGIGGIQQASRLTVAAVAEIASGYGWYADFLSLNDPPGQHTLSFNGASIPFSGFGRAKLRFVLSAVAHARARTRIILAAHPYLAVAAAQMKLLQPRARTIVISHGVEVWKRLAPLRRRTLLSADILVAPSRYTIDRLIDVQQAPRIRMRQLPWPLGPDFLNLVSCSATPPLPKDFPAGLVVLAVARLSRREKYKGVDQLIRAIAHLAPKLPPLHLAVVASGDDINNHEQLARELGIPDRVRFLTDLSPNEIAACYSRCDVFALPSTGEGFGFVFLEAMAFGKPVVGANIGGAAEIIEHEKTGLLAGPGDPNGLLRSLARLVTNDSLRVSLGKAGANSIRANFRFDAFRSRLEQILRECGLASEKDQ